MADEIDAAQAHEERMRAAAIEAAVSSANSRQGDGARDCHFCGDEIPEQRREAVPGCVTCVDCQERLERGMGGR